MLHLG